MKHFLLLLVLFAFHGDAKPDYNLLIGSWMHKNYKDTTDTALFSFSNDSILTLKMFRSETDEVIGSIKGRYGINKKENTLFMEVFGRPKTFNILALKKDVLTIKNITDNKDAQTFERLEGK